jgi:hypothetical protein
MSLTMGEKRACTKFRGANTVFDFASGNAGANPYLTIESDSMTHCGEDYRFISGTQQMQYTYPKKGTYATGMVRNCCRIAHLIKGNSEADYEIYMYVDLASKYTESPIPTAQAVVRIRAGTKYESLMLGGVRYPVKFQFQDSQYSGLKVPVPSCRNTRRNKEFSLSLREDGYMMV